MDVRKISKRPWCYKLFVVIFSILILFSPTTSTMAITDEELDYFANNNILFYEPDSSKNFCTSGGDCYIAGETRDKKLWSALRHVGFTPEQAAGVMGNIVHEGHSPTRQEEAYNIARDRNCRTQEGKPYDIYIDATDGVHHASCMQSIYHGYAAGNGVAGVGLGFIQWTSHGRRLGFIEKMQELGLLKYFEGNAYKTYGRYTDSQLQEAIKKETGSDRDYWALWCASIKFIWTEMNDSYSAFFSKSTVAEYAGYTATFYEACQGCSPGAGGYNSRIASAEEFYRKYQSGEFDDVESGNLPSATGSTDSTGGNVTIIGDNVTNSSLTALNSTLPDADIHAKDSKHFTTDASNNPSGLSIIKELKNSNSLRDIVVYALGSNDTVSKDNIKSVVDEIGPSRKIFFLTNYDISDTNKYDNNNKEFSAASSTYDNVKVIDWKNAILTASGSPSDYIENETSTAIRPTAKGAELFAKTIQEAINGVRPSDTCAGTIDGDYEIYYQKDEPWGPMPYGDCYVSPTDPGDIAQAGCGPSSLAMIITALTKQRITPDVIAKKAVKAGYRVCGSGSYATIANLAKDYGLKVQNYGRLSIGQISQYLRQGMMFQIVGSGPVPLSNLGHFIGVRGITSSGKWLIFDSAHKGQGTNEREWDPSEIYPYVGDWWGISR